MSPGFAVPIPITEKFSDLLTIEGKILAQFKFQCLHDFGPHG